jgi:hypothetical protein
MIAHFICSEGNREIDTKQNDSIGATGDARMEPVGIQRENNLGESGEVTGSTRLTRPRDLQLQSIHLNNACRCCAMA